MFIPLHQIPRDDGTESRQCRERWNSDDGRKTHNIVMNEMRTNAREHFLQHEFEYGMLPILEDNTDLRGITIHDEIIAFPKDDNFKGTDFSCSSWYNARLSNAVFICLFSWAKIHNCEFRGCTFICPGFMFTRIEKSKFIGCDFIMSARFLNCDFESTSFQDCHFTEPVFIDCCFDSSTTVGDFRMIGMAGESYQTDLRDVTRLYAGIRSAYADGQVFPRARDYFFRERHAASRHNTTSLRDKASELCWEFLAGYGVRPTRVLRAMIIIFIGSGLINAQSLGVGQGMRLAAGAFFTFGVGADTLPSLPVFHQVLYVVTAFLGVSLTALLVTVLANAYMRLR